MSLTGRYANVRNTSDTIRGREVSIPDIPFLPSIDDLGPYYMIVDDPRTYAPWDAAAAHYIGDESSYWLYYAINFLLEPNPFETVADFRIYPTLGFLQSLDSEMLG